jgi:hypothetical protein
MPTNELARLAQRPRSIWPFSVVNSHLAFASSREQP